MTLYILGNGFDIANNMHTQYRYFRDFVKKNGKKNTFEFMEELFELDFDWKNFEEALGHPKSISLTIDKLKYGEFVKKEIQELFNKWILETDIASDKEKIALFKENSVFLTFNYTSTLEIAYDIPLAHVCHIHRYSGDQLFFNKECDLVFGHGEKPSHPLDYSLKACLYKDTKAYYEKSKSFFEKWMPYVFEIAIIGFSYSLIDIYYFQKINEMAPQIKWHCGFHTEKDKLNAQLFMKKLGIKNYTIESNERLLEGLF